MRFGLIAPVLLALLLTTTAGAHTGHDDGAAPASPPASLPDRPPAGPAMDSAPPTESPAPAGLDMYGVEPPSGPSGPELLGEGLLVPEPPAVPEAGPHAGHPMKMNEPHVAPAEHRMVSTATKGYGVAAGITLLSGLVFGILTWMRPFE